LVKLGLEFIDENGGGPRAVPVIDESIVM
jgi:hypothetical protein